MNHRPLLLVTIVCIISIVLGLSLMIACAIQVPPIKEADEAAIYSAVIRQLYGPDDTSGGTLKPPIVYLIGITNDSIDPKIDQPSSKILTEPLRNEIVALLDDLPPEFIWVESSQDVTRDSLSGKPIDNGIIIRLGNIHKQRIGSVHVSGSIYFASLAASGQIFVLKKANGLWEVVKTGILWIS